MIEVAIPIALVKNVARTLLVTPMLQTWTGVGQQPAPGAVVSLRLGVARGAVCNLHDSAKAACS
jgi:hypothetical protein